MPVSRPKISGAPEIKVHEHPLQPPILSVIMWPERGTTMHGDTIVDNNQIARLEHERPLDLDQRLPELGHGSPRIVVGGSRAGEVHPEVRILQAAVENGVWRDGRGPAAE